MYHSGRRSVGFFVLALIVTATPRAPLAATIHVPLDQPTIQAAIDAAAPGDTIVVEPGTYQESLRISGDKADLTIAAADEAHPPEIHGFRSVGADGIRIDRVDGITLSHLRIVGAYDGVRLLSVAHTSLVGLHIENNALGVRVEKGSDNSIVGCTVRNAPGDRGVEQTILVDYSPRALVTDNLIIGSKREGIRVFHSPCVHLARNVIQGSRGGDGIAISSSVGASLEGSSVSGSMGNGIRIGNSPELVLLDNTAIGNRSVGLRIEKSPPYATVADVLADGNTASDNGDTEIVVQPQRSRSSTVPACEPIATVTPRPPLPTPHATVRPSVTATPPESTPVRTATGRPPVESTPTPTRLPNPVPTVAGPQQWRMYAQIARSAGSATNVPVPLRSTDPPLTIAILPEDISAFPKDAHTTSAQVAALGGDTLGRLTDAADAYARSHPADYPGYAAVLSLTWTARVGP